MAPALEPAEFYFLHDGRGEFELIYNLNQVEADPQETTRLAREIARRRMAVDPDWTAYAIAPAYFDLPNVAMDPELVLAATAFAAPRPAVLAHCDGLINPTEGQTSAYYDVVSADWKAAIESLEPGVHQFFAHELRFSDGVVADRFVFRCRAQIENAPWNYRVDSVLDLWSDVSGYRFVVDETFSVPTLDREQLAGRHFVNVPSRRANYVSRALAEKLLPLLPERVALLPVRLSGEEPQSVAFVSPAMVDQALRSAFEAAPAAPERRPAFGGPWSSQSPPPRPLDPELAEAIAELNGPFSDPSRNEKAQATLRSRLEGASVERIFVILAEALKFDVPLDNNYAANISYLECHQRNERELIPYCRAWAADPAPARRVVVARVLSREIDASERPDPATFAILTGLLDDPDPNVVAKTMGILGWLFHPAYDQAMRSRRDRFAHHENPKVREACRAFIDKEQEQAAQRSPEFPGEDVASLFASSFDAMRSGNGGSGPHLEALRHRDAADLLAVAARWAEDANPDKRKLAAEALERPWGNQSPAPRALIAVLRKLAGDGDAAVAGAAVKALDAARAPGPVGGGDLDDAEPAAAHPSAAARAAYADSLAFGQSPEALDALLALADDPAEEVRRSVALNLSSYIEDSVGARRKRLRETLAGLMSDPDKYVRYFAITAFVRFDDPRVVDAILREFEGPEAELATLYKFLLPCVLAKPDKRYLPGLQRLNAKFPGAAGLDEAIGACRVKRWFPWG